MVNASEFSARLKQLIEHLSMASSAFAESIDVNRSSISHLLSGRNKPSLDVIVKILEAYPEVDLYWLLNGKGEFPTKRPNNDSPLTNESSEIPKKTIAAISNETKKTNQVIDKVVFFYKDGSFKSYQN